MKEQYKGEFITEDDLKHAFDEMYVQRQIKSGAIKRHSYESMRYGGADLVTAEYYKGVYQIRAFEFKLKDWRKALGQAKENLKFAHQSFIVLPSNQVKNALETGADFIKENKIGIIGVDPVTKHWKIEKYAYSQKDDEISLSQEIFKLLLGEVN